MVHFQLAPRQQSVKAMAAKASRDICASAYAHYSKHSDQLSRFHATRPYYAQLVQAGLLKAMIPKSVGGDCEKWVDHGLIVEELHAVDASLSIHLIGTVLGLLPLILGGTSEQKKRFLAPFLSGEGDHLASLTHSEPAGTANHLEKGGKGLGVTARKEGDYYIVNGDKLWTTNSAGWDGKGATLSCLVVRYSDDGGPEKLENMPADNIMVLLVTREIVAQNSPEAYQMLSEPDLMGHIAVTGPHTRYNNFRVPADHVLFLPGVAAPIVEASFGITGAVVGAMAVGTMRTAFELALNFARADARGGSMPIIERQSVADLMIEVKLSVDTARAIVWKALDSLDARASEGKITFENCLEAKIYSSEVALPTVYKCMQAVGMTSYANKSVFPRLLNDAAVFSLFDGGNVGIRRRQFQRLMCEAGYKPWANL